jgi:hypothetical protein
VGSIELEVDLESVGEPDGPYDDHTDWPVKWDYETRGYLKAKIDVVDPDGNRVKRVIRAQVEKVTVPWTALTEFCFFEGTFRGKGFNGYIGGASGVYHMYLPILGQFLGGNDNYGIIYSSEGDFSYELNDTLTPPW